MPPSSPVADSGASRTAQRTSKNSATTGIFSRNISQMNVHVSTCLDRIPGRGSVQPTVEDQYNLRSRISTTYAEGWSSSFCVAIAIVSTVYIRWLSLGVRENTRPPCSQPERPSSRSARAAELRDRVQLVHARGDLRLRQALHALGAELLDVERREHRSVGHCAAQQSVGKAVLQVGGDEADEAAGERVAGAGRVDHGLQRIRRQREEAVCVTSAAPYS